jgi:hypothetical protein
MFQVKINLQELYACEKSIPHKSIDDNWKRGSRRKVTIWSLAT